MAGGGDPPRDPEGPRSLQRYLLDGERVVVALHQHWAEVAEPVGTAVAGLAAAFWLDEKLGATAPVFTNLIWLAWAVLAARALYRLLERRHDWIVATDKRLLVFYGLITQRVAMMPLPKVTDMSYVRTPAGRLLGYGMFVLESAGQDQALREIKWVPQPDITYRRICAEIFDVAGRQDPPPPGGGGGDAGGGDGGEGEDAGYAGPPGPAGGPRSWSTAIPVRRAAPPPDRGEDTGPIPVIQPYPQPRSLRPRPRPPTEH